MSRWKSTQAGHPPSALSFRTKEGVADKQSGVVSTGTFVVCESSSSVKRV